MKKISIVLLVLVALVAGMSLVSCAKAPADVIIGNWSVDVDAFLKSDAMKAQLQQTGLGSIDPAKLSNPEALANDPEIAKLKEENPMASFALDMMAGMLQSIRNMTIEISKDKIVMKITMFDQPQTQELSYAITKTEGTVLTVGTKDPQGKETEATLKVLGDDSIELSMEGQALQLKRVK